MNLTRTILVMAAAMWCWLSISHPVYAGPYTDDLTKCIVESTSPQDRIDFVKWMFSAMAKHPAVKSMSSVSEEQRNEISQKIADLFMKLLTETCREKAEKAIKYEGQLAMQNSFQVLGQVAAQELFTNPDVASVLSGLDKYIDTEKLKSSLGIK